jgi:hypothetical protein
LPPSVPPVCHEKPCCVWRRGAFSRHKPKSTTQWNVPMSRLKHKETSLDKKPHTVTLPKGTKSHRELSGSPEADFTHVLVLQTVQTFWVSPFGEEEKSRHYQAGLAALKGFQPRDEL